MASIVALDAPPAILILIIGLVVLIHRRAVLGRGAPVAIAGVVAMLASTLGDVLLGVYAYRTISAGTLDLPWWTEAADLVLLPVDLLALPLLTWAILARRSPRSAEVPA